MTYNLIWRRRTRDVAFHFSSLPSHGILDRITGDNGRTCKRKFECQREKIFNHECRRQFVSQYCFSISDMLMFFFFKVQLEATIHWVLFFCFLTVDSEGDLSLPDSDPRDDGFAHVLAGIGLAHGLQIQLVAVTQNLGGVEENTQKWPQEKPTYTEK